MLLWLPSQSWVNGFKLNVLFQCVNMTVYLHYNFSGSKRIHLVICVSHKITNTYHCGTHAFKVVRAILCVHFITWLIDFVDVFFPFCACTFSSKFNSLFVLVETLCGPPLQHLFLMLVFSCIIVFILSLSIPVCLRSINFSCLQVLTKFICNLNHCHCYLNYSGYTF